MTFVHCVIVRAVQIELEKEWLDYAKNIAKRRQKLEREWYGGPVNMSWTEAININRLLISPEIDRLLRRKLSVV